jgi:hypothetical protein
MTFSGASDHPRAPVQDWELVVGGAGPKPTAPAFGQSVRTREKVRFVGRLARSQVRLWMQWTDVQREQVLQLPGVIAEARWLMTQ